VGHNNRIANQAIRLNWDDCAEFCCQLLENDVSISELKLTKIIEKENRLVLLVIPEAKALALPRASKKSSRRFKISPWKQMGKGGAQREKLSPRDQNPTILLASRAI
jgi:hypothetical protein